MMYMYMFLSFFLLLSFFFSFFFYIYIAIFSFLFSFKKKENKNMNMGIQFSFVYRYLGLQTLGNNRLNLKKSQHLGYSTPYNTRSHNQVVYMGSYFPSPFFMFASWYSISLKKKNRRSFPHRICTHHCTHKTNLLETFTSTY